ncbi:XdhC family protein [Thalassotalea fusca]
MQQQWSSFSNVFNTHNAFVLAVIVDTQGSTYHKAGAMMLVDSAGKSTGLLSGGCLEEDICLHAQSVMQGNQVKRLSYNLQSDDESLWGLGLGCDGSLDIALLPLNQQNAYLSFDKVIDAVKNGQSGQYQFSVGDKQTACASFVNESQESRPSSVGAATFPYEQFQLSIEPSLHIVICGAGPDAEPLVAMMKLLGWTVSIIDHRKVALRRHAFNSCQNKVLMKSTAEMASLFMKANGVVIMTHSLERDGLLLSTVLNENVDYIGLLGPKTRRDKLLERQCIPANQIEKIHGPIGLNIGGRGPEAIALSICAEIQAYFAKSVEKNSELIVSRCHGEVEFG